MKKLFLECYNARTGRDHEFWYVVVSVLASVWEWGTEVKGGGHKRTHAKMPRPLPPPSFHNRVMVNLRQAMLT